MDPMTIGLIGGGALGVADWLSSRGKEERSKKLRAAEIRTSPWTGMAPSTQIQESNFLGSVMAPVAAGANLGSAWEQLGAKTGISKAYENLLNAEAVKAGGAPVASSLSTQPSVIPAATNPFKGFIPAESAIGAAKNVGGSIYSGLENLSGYLPSVEDYAPLVRGATPWAIW